MNETWLEVREIVSKDGSLLYDERSGMWLSLRWPGLSGGMK